MATDTPPELIRDDGDISLSTFTIVDLSDLSEHPENYDFFTFRPHLEKLMLAGTAEAQHISILWYTIPDGSVGRHYHAMTESVYTIVGNQTDAQGAYPNGSLCFNPPGSGHAITGSTGFFILAYASPPDFVNIDRIQNHTPVHINTADPGLETLFPFKSVCSGVAVYDIPLDPAGGMSAQFIKSDSGSYGYTGHYVLILKGRCTINGTSFDPNRLIVATTVAPQTYDITTAPGHSCLALGLSFVGVP